MKSVSGSVRSASLCSLVLALAGCGGRAEAVDHVLVIGGGSDPSSNALALERNVAYVTGRLAESVESHVFFADGTDPGRDLRTYDARLEVAPARELLSILFGETDGLRARYRDHRVPDVDGPATPAALDAWFDGPGSRLAAGDRLFVYVTGHGDVADDGDDPRNTVMLLWEGDYWTVRDFAARLDRLDPAVPVTVVMVNCYCGGFSDLVYRGGDAANGLAEADRCGFFATTYDRQAAGCSDDPEGPEAEYSLPFFSAIFGRSPKGSTIVGADFDGDGLVGGDEAHAFATTHLDTIDVPVTTAEEFAIRHAGEDAVPWSPGVLESVPAVTRAALTELCLQTGLSVDDGLAATAEERIERQRAETRRLADELDGLLDESDGLMFEIEAAVIRRWPELSGIWHPAVPAILEDDADEIVTAIAGHDDWPAVEELDGRIGVIDERLADAELGLAKLRRVAHLVEYARCAATLAGRDTGDDHRRIVRSERAAIFRPAVPER